MKSHIGQYVNAGRDANNAADMKQVFDSYSRVRGYHASEVNVNTNAQEMHNHNCTGVISRQSRQVWTI